MYTCCYLKYNLPNEIPIVFHNGSNYGYHFIIKELANESEDQFECLGENTEKYNFFLSRQKKKLKILKDCDESVVTISYKIKFVDSAIFLASSLSNGVDNLAEVIHKTTCKHFDRFS